MPYTLTLGSNPAKYFQLSPFTLARKHKHWTLAFLPLSFFFLSFSKKSFGSFLRLEVF